MKSLVAGSVVKSINHLRLKCGVGVGRVCGGGSVIWQLMLIDDSLGCGTHGCVAWKSACGFIGPLHRGPICFASCRIRKGHSVALCRSGSSSFYLMSQLFIHRPLRVRVLLRFTCLCVDP